LPIDYRLNSSHIVLDAAGKLDAAATLTKPKPGAPLFFDDVGRPHGTRYGEFLGASISRALDPNGQALLREIPAEGKRVEIYRLAVADGQPRVQLRFLQAGRFGCVWASDGLRLCPLETERRSR